MPLDQDRAVERPVRDALRRHPGSTRRQRLAAQASEARAHRFDHDPQRADAAQTGDEVRRHHHSRQPHCASPSAAPEQPLGLRAPVTCSPRSGCPDARAGSRTASRGAGRPAFVYSRDPGPRAGARPSGPRRCAIPSSPSSRYAQAPGWRSPAGTGRHHVVDKHGQAGRHRRRPTTRSTWSSFQLPPLLPHRTWATRRAPAARGASLHAPGALAQHARTAAGCPGNFFVLDTSNDRVSGGHGRLHLLDPQGPQRNSGGDDDGGNNGGGGGGYRT